MTDMGVNGKGARFRLTSRLVWIALALATVLLVLVWATGCGQKSDRAFPVSVILPPMPTPLQSLNNLTPTPTALALSSPTVDGIFRFPVTEDLFQGELSVEGKPVLLQPIKLRFSITPIEAASSVALRLILPDSVEPVNGDLEWTGNLDRGEAVVHEVVLRTTQTGVSRIRFHVEAVFLENHVETKNYFVFFLSLENRGEISSEPYEDQDQIQQQPAQGGE